MKTCKHWFFVAVFLLITGTFYVNAQDMIVLKDENMIEVKVMEISPSEIRYKRFDHLDGPTIVIPSINVLSIKYENGTYEIINAGAMPQQENTKTTAMNPNKFIFGINANAGGALGYIWEGASGFGINIELGKGNFNNEINFMFLKGGFGFLYTFNGFWHGRIGGFYLGGGIGYSTFEVYGRIGQVYYPGYYAGNKWGGYHVYGHSEDIYGYYTTFSFPFGLNIGYKFITKSGLYFRTGAFAGFDFGFLLNEISPFYLKPDLAIGWTMR